MNPVQTPATVSMPVPVPVSVPQAGMPLIGHASGQMLLACELDHVFLTGSAEDRLHLYQLISRHPDIKLVFMTGRGQEAVLPLLDDPTLPLPDYLICDAGATLVDLQLQPVAAIQAEIDARWPGEHVVSTALAEIEGLQRQDVPQRNRCGYLCPPDAVKAELLGSIEQLGCAWLYTDDQYLDVLPKGVSKASTLQSLVDHLGMDPAAVLVATDMLDASDIVALNPLVRLVHVSPKNLASAGRTPSDRHVLRARRPGCGAVLEAMAHFGFLGEKAMRLLVDKTAPTGEARLVVVYHRLPYEETVQNGKRIRRRPTSPNGIIPTLLSFFRSGVEGSWVAWSIHEAGMDHFEVHTAVDAERFPNLTAARVPLTKAEVDTFYKRFSKEAFWPVLHTFWERARFNEADWGVFQQVNRAFAQASAREAAPGATVWLHDYNLWMVPAYLRELRPDVRIAFFHHTHFPSSDVFNVIPWRRQIVASLLQCDYIGFHIPRQVENFVDVVRGMAPVEVLESTGCAPRFQTYGCAVGLDKMSTRLRVGERTVRLGAHPVGLDMQRIQDALASTNCKNTQRAIAQSRGGCRLILSVERLDYTKGVLQKLLAYEQVLESHPELHGTITLVTVCVPAASEMNIYDELQLQIEQVAGRINGRFSRVGWQPLQYFFRSFSFEDITAFYAQADVMWITPLCDGLNLVAMEYAATQGLTGGHGVLVLSEFTGAAALLKDAVLTQPHDPLDLQARLLQALQMDGQERQLRMRGLVETVTHHNLQRWGEDFLAAANADTPSPPDTAATAADAPC